MTSSKNKNVVPIKLCSCNKNIISNHANKSVINDLEAMLKRAKNGEIISFVAVELSDQEIIDNMLSGDWRENCNSFIGMLADIQYMMLKHRNGD